MVGGGGIVDDNASDNASKTWLIPLAFERDYWLVGLNKNLTKIFFECKSDRHQVCNYAIILI